MNDSFFVNSFFRFKYFSGVIFTIFGLLISFLQFMNIVIVNKKNIIFNKMLFLIRYVFLRFLPTFARLHSVAAANTDQNKYMNFLERNN